MAMNGASNEEMEKAIEASKEFIDENHICYADVYERQAQIIAVSKTTEWIRMHPGYSMDELHEAKARFLEEARGEIRKAIHELEDKRRTDLTEAAKQLKAEGKTNEEIAGLLNIPESTVRNCLA